MSERDGAKLHFANNFNLFEFELKLKEKFDSFHAENLNFEQFKIVCIISLTELLNHSLAFIQRIGLLNEHTQEEFNIMKNPEAKIETYEFIMEIIEGWRK